jgi:hypothetical protein
MFRELFNADEEMPYFIGKFYCELYGLLLFLELVTFYAGFLLLVVVLGYCYITVAAAISCLPDEFVR